LSCEDDGEAVQVTSISLQVGSTLSSRVELNFLHNIKSDQITETATETWTTTTRRVVVMCKEGRERLSRDSTVRYKRWKSHHRPNRFRSLLSSGSWRKFARRGLHYRWYLWKLSDLNRTRDNFAEQTADGRRAGQSPQLISHRESAQASRGEIPNFCPMRAVLSRREMAAA